MHTSPLQTHKVSSLAPVETRLGYFTILALIIVSLSGVSVDAAEDLHGLAPNDLHQLWPAEAWKFWESKTEAELLRLANEGGPAAQFMLWYKWRGSSRWKEGLTLLEKASKAGLPQAMNEWGINIFCTAEKSSSERLEGWNLMEKAAEQGYVFAKVNLAEFDAGFTSPDGFPVKANLKRALEFLRDAADAGHTESMVHLALLYSSGIGEPRHEKETPHNLLLAASGRRNADAMLHLSARYAYGHGERVDPLESGRWHYLALHKSTSPPSSSVLLDAQGNPTAQDSVARDEQAKAASLFEKTGEYKDPRAAFALARRYFEAGSPAESVVLFRLAAGWGNAEAAAELKKIEPAVTSAQKKLAEARLSFLLPNQQ